MAEVEQITAGTEALFRALVEDAPNWSGASLFGGNVRSFPSDKGHLTHLKKLGFVVTEIDDDKTVWVYFTNEGKRIAADLGYSVEVTDNLLIR